MPNAGGTQDSEKKTTATFIAHRFALLTFFFVFFIGWTSLSGVLWNYFAEGNTYLFRAFYFASDIFGIFAPRNYVLLFDRSDVIFAGFLALIFTFLDYPFLRRTGVFVVSLTMSLMTTLPVLYTPIPGEIAPRYLLIFAIIAFFRLAIPLLFITEILSKLLPRLINIPVAFFRGGSVILLLLPYIALAYFILPNDVTHCDSVRFSERRDACYVNILMRNKPADGYKLCADVSQLKRREQCEEIFLDYAILIPSVIDINKELCESMKQLLGTRGCYALLKSTGHDAWLSSVGLGEELTVKGTTLSVYDVVSDDNCTRPECFQAHASSTQAARVTINLRGQSGSGSAMMGIKDSIKFDEKTIELGDVSYDMEDGRLLFWFEIF